MEGGGWAGSLAGAAPVINSASPRAAMVTNSVGSDLWRGQHKKQILGAMRGILHSALSCSLAVASILSFLSILKSKQKREICFFTQERSSLPPKTYWTKVCSGQK